MTLVSACHSGLDPESLTGALSVGTAGAECRALLKTPADARLPAPAKACSAWAPNAVLTNHAAHRLEKARIRAVRVKNKII